jgi:hypothetical protein
MWNFDEYSSISTSKTQPGLPKMKRVGFVMMVTSAQDVGR